MAGCTLVPAHLVALTRAPVSEVASRVDQVRLLSGDFYEINTHLIPEVPRNDDPTTVMTLSNVEE